MGTSVVLALITIVLIAVITSHKRLMNAKDEKLAIIEESQAKLRALSNELIQTQENERARISRELHDEIGQTLTAVNLNLEMINGEGDIKESDLSKWIDDCQKLVQKTLKNIHRFSHDLRPTVLDNLGLLPAIRTHVNGFKERTGITVEIEDEGEVHDLKDNLNTILYRVTQEALNNVLKHAEAHNVMITITRNENVIILRITDDGIGFDREKKMVSIPGNSGLGLPGMRERIQLVGGELSVSSKNGIGTTLMVEIPLNEG